MRKQAVPKLCDLKCMSGLKKNKKCSAYLHDMNLSLKVQMHTDMPEIHSAPNSRCGLTTHDILRAKWCQPCPGVCCNQTNPLSYSSQHKAWEG